MATLEVRGYVNEPTSHESAKGGYSKFRLGVTQKNRAYKDKPETKTYYNVDCVNFASGSPPPAGAFVTVSGYLDIREYESKAGKNAGKIMQGMSLNVQSLDVAPPRDGQAPAVQKGDPFANPAPGEDEIPF